MTTRLLLQVLLPLLLCTSLANAQTIYRWHDSQGNIHFGEEPPENARATPITVEPNVIKVVPLATPVPTAAPTPIASSPTPAEPELSKRNRKTDERICWLRYGLPCNELWHWKSREHDACVKRHDVRCDSPIWLLRRRPASVLERDLDWPFPRSGEIRTTDLTCLLKSGFYCRELQDQNTCLDNYGLSCATLEHWADEAAQRRCPHNPADCPLQRVVADRPRSFAERDFLRTGRDPILFDTLRIRRDEPEYWPQAEALLNRYPGK